MELENGVEGQENAQEQAILQLEKAALEHSESHDVEVEKMNKQELVKHLQEINQHEQLSHSMTLVKELKERFDDILKAEQQEQLSRFLENGGDKLEFEPSRDPLATEFYTAHKAYYEKRKQIQENKEKALTKALLAKKKLIEQLKDLIDVNQENIGKKYHEFQAIQTAWREAGMVAPAEALNLKMTYSYHCDRFFEQLKLNRELVEMNFKRNQDAKTDLCVKAEELLKSDSPTKALASYRALLEDWKHVGYTAKEVNEQLWLRFKAVGDTIHEQIRVRNSQAEEQKKINLGHKLELTALLEQLLSVVPTTHQAWQKATKDLDAIWATWQNVGFVPKEDGDNCWNRFKELKSKFYDLKNHFYTELKKGYATNLARKEEICVQADELKLSTDWATASEKLKALQKDWQKVGQVPQSDSERLWKRFRGACDYFFEQKAKHYAIIEEEQKANIALKDALLEKIGQFTPSKDIKESIAQLKQLQEEWKVIGKVPKSDVDRINKAYKDLLDAKFEGLRMEGGAEERALMEAKYQNLSQSKDGQNELIRERNRKLDRIKKLQDEISLLDNNKLLFAKSKNTDEILKSFDSKIRDIQFQIKKVQEELKLITELNIN